MVDQLTARIEVLDCCLEDRCDNWSPVFRLNGKYGTGSQPQHTEHVIEAIDFLVTRDLVSFNYGTYEGSITPIALSDLRLAFEQGGDGSRGLFHEGYCLEITPEGERVVHLPREEWMNVLNQGLV